MIPRVLVTGAGGLLGRACVAQGAVGLDRAACDVTSISDLDRALRTIRPDAVIFCAAYTDVDTADSPDAWRVNVDAPAKWAERVPTWLVSSNFVFSGVGPHGLEDEPAPVQAYGQQKLAAEAAVSAAGGSVVRTGWLYGAGGSNFPSTLPRRLRSGPVRAIADTPVQPTYAADLAQYLLSLPKGVSHAVGSEETTWYMFARAVAEMLEIDAHIDPIEGETLNADARRPSDGRLVPALLPGWTTRLSAFLGAEE